MVTSMSDYSLNLWVLGVADFEVDEEASVVHGAGEWSLVSDKPLFHGVLHDSETVAILVLLGVSSLTAEDLEEMVLAITNVWRNAATEGLVVEIVLDLDESVRGVLEGFLASDDVEVNEGWWRLLVLNDSVEDLLGHVELVGLRVLWVSS